MQNFVDCETCDIQLATKLKEQNWYIDGGFFPGLPIADKLLVYVEWITPIIIYVFF
jgi:hypothetical protein